MKAKLLQLLARAVSILRKKKPSITSQAIAYLMMVRFVIFNFGLVSGCGGRILTAVVVLDQSLFQPMNYLGVLLA